MSILPDDVDFDSPWSHECTEIELLQAKAAILRMRSGLSEIIEEGRTGASPAALADIADYALHGGYNE